MKNPWNQSQIFETINKIDRPLARLIRKKIGKKQLVKIEENKQIS